MNGYILLRMAFESWFETEGENIWVRRLLWVVYELRDMHAPWVVISKMTIKVMNTLVFVIGDLILIY